LHHAGKQDNQTSKHNYITWWYNRNPQCSLHGSI